jgi:exonuclease SbcC
LVKQVKAFKLKLLSEESNLKKTNDVYANLEVLKKAFSTNGLVAYKIENLVKDLEDLVNQYLAELSDGRFGLEFVVTNDKLNVVISDEGRDIDILALSSGELARVNTSTLLAIRKLMSTLSKSKINVLFLDEVIGVLDDEGREKLIEVLLKEHDLNTFLVSHGWSHPLLSKVNVIKEKKISRLEWQ